MKTQTLVENYDQWLKFETWNEYGQVFYTDWQHTVIQLDLESHTMSAKGTATPRP
jgi:hypothetical protein